jgi:UDP-glucose 4-epimerase
MIVGMKVLVTGGAGFIGGHVCEELARDPRVSEVRVADNLSTGRMLNLAGVGPKLVFERLNIAAYPDCPFVTESDAIVHLAAIPNVSRSIEDPLRAHENGDWASLCLLDIARRRGPKRIVMASSAAIYGDAQPPIDEDAPLRPLSPYAAGKAAMEAYARAYAECYGLDVTCLRFFNVFGPRQDPTSPYSGVISKFCDVLKNDSVVNNCVIYGDGEQTRDFIYVKDVAVAVGLAVVRGSGMSEGYLVKPQPSPGFSAYNVGRGAPTSINEIYRALAALAKNSGWERKPARTGEIKHSHASIVKVRSGLGFDPRSLHTLDQGLRETFEWVRRQSAS